MGYFITNSQFLFVYVPIFLSLCSNTLRSSQTTRFRVVAKFWGPVDKYWPLMILWRMVTKLRRAYGIPFRNSGVQIAIVVLSLSIGWVLMATFIKSNLSVSVFPMVSSGFQEIGVGGPQIFQSSLDNCILLNLLTFSILFTCLIVF